MELILRGFNAIAALIAIIVLHKEGACEKAGDLKNALKFCRITSVLGSLIIISCGVISLIDS